jgi:predicted phosphoribosyltransferase
MRDVFENRKQAGMLLGKYLSQKYHWPHCMVIGIPRGGVETAFYVSQSLHAELSVIVSKKLPFPGHPEYGFGAISEEDIVYLNDTSSKLLSQHAIENIVAEQRVEIKRRVKLYRNTEPLPDMQGKPVILVDDGIATGVTLVPVVRLCRKKQAAQIIVAAPVSGNSYDPHLDEADAVEVLIRPEGFHAVGQVYLDFSEFDDSQLLEILKKAKSGAKAQANAR